MSSASIPRGTSQAPQDVWLSDCTCVCLCAVTAWIDASDDCRRWWIGQRTNINIRTKMFIRQLWLSSLHLRKPRSLFGALISESNRESLHRIEGIKKRPFSSCDPQACICKNRKGHILCNFFPENWSWPWTEHLYSNFEHLLSAIDTAKKAFASVHSLRG